VACGLGLGYLIIVDLKPKFYLMWANLELVLFVFKRVLSITWVVPLLGADLDWISKVAMLLCD
jgi:hypothetical protein